MKPQEQEIVKTLRDIYTYHGISADPEDATVITYIERLINRVNEI